MIYYFTLPGLGGSDNEHWQSRFEKVLPNCKRIEQKNWDKPNCEEWVKTINDALKGYDLSKVVLISHSLGGIALSHWVNTYHKKVKGAFIVAPPHVEGVSPEYELNTFLPVPLKPFLFPTTLVASTNDQWSGIEDSKQLAEHWGSKFINIGDAGHINSDSGFGAWEEGQDILGNLIEE